MTDAPDPADFRPEARAPRGFADRRARDLAAERRILTSVSAVYERYGFELLDTGAFEYADALGKFLPDADRPNAGVFAIQDDDDQWMALRYDLTAPLARFAAQNWETLAKPFRRYAFGPVWRNEKPGPGRFRQFTQCDADTVGSARPEADAEIIAMAAGGLEAVGLRRGQAVIKVSNRKLLDGLLIGVGVTDPAQKLIALRAMDKLDRLGLRGVAELLGAGRLDESGDFTKGAQLGSVAIDAILKLLQSPADDRGETLDGLSRIGASGAFEEGLKELGQVDHALNAMGVASDQVRFDPSIVRGLEYYTGVVFEADLQIPTLDDKGQPVRFGSVGGGGRYDDLVARFTGESVPATGFSFGVSRLAAALEAAGAAAGPDRVRGPIVVIVFSPDDMPHYFAVAAQLRAAGIAAEVYLGSSGMKAQMKYADRRMSPAAIMLGGDEINAGTVTIKDLDMGRELAGNIAGNEAWKAQRPGQITVPRGELIASVRAILGT